MTELSKLGKRMAVRQQALATAQVYVRRFYTRREIRTTNPWLVLSTAFYLACKMEECPQHIRIVVGEARQFWPGITPNSSAPPRAQVPRLTASRCSVI
jgi:cyclin-C